MTIQDFLPADARLHAELAPQLGRMSVRLVGKNKPRIHGRRADCEKVMLTLVDNGLLDAACDVFSACKGARRRDLAKSDWFAAFTRQLASTPPGEKSAKAFAQALGEMAAHQVKVRRDAFFVEKLLNCCPPWAMHGVLEGLADAEPSAALQKMLTANPSLAHALRTVLASHGESQAAVKLQGVLAPVPLPPQPIIAAPDPRHERIQAYLAAVEMEGESPATMEMQTALLFELQTELVSQGWGMWDRTGEFKLIGPPMSEDIVEKVYLMVAIMAAREVTLKTALQLGVELKEHAPPGGLDLHSPAALLAAGVLEAQVEVETTIGWMVFACVEHLKSKQRVDSNHQHELEFEIQFELEKLARVLRETSLPRDDNEPGLERPFRGLVLGPLRAQVVKRRLSEICSSISLSPRAQAYLRSKLPVAMARLAMFLCASRADLRKELAWIARFSDELTLFNAVFQAFVDDPYALPEETMYRAIEVLHDEYPECVAQVCSELVRERVNPVHINSQVKIVLGAGGKAKVTFSSGADAALALDALAVCSAAVMFNKGVWPIALEFLPDPRGDCEELCREFIVKALGWKAPVARAAMHDVEYLKFAVEPVILFAPDPFGLVRDLAGGPKSRPIKASHFQFLRALLMAGWTQGADNAMVSEIDSWIKARLRRRVGLNPADEDARLALSLLSLTWLSSRGDASRTLDELILVLNEILPGNVDDIEALKAFDPVVRLFAYLVMKVELIEADVCRRILKQVAFEPAVRFILGLLDKVWYVPTPGEWRVSVLRLVDQLGEHPPVAATAVGGLLYRLMARRGPGTTLWRYPVEMSDYQVRVLRAAISAANAAGDPVIAAELRKILDGVPRDVWDRTGGSVTG